MPSILLFVSSFQHDDILTTLSKCSIGWLCTALILKSLSLLLREVRLWLALPSPRPRFVPTMNIGVFAILMSMQRDGQSVTEIASLRMISETDPGKAIALLILLFSVGIWQATKIKDAKV